MIVIVGFAGLGIVLKGCGYPNGELMGVRWNPLAVFMREHVASLLLLPVLWVAYACAAERKDRGWLSYRIALVIGLFIAGCILAAFLFASVHPFTRPLLIYTR